MLQKNTNAKILKWVGCIILNLIITYTVYIYTKNQINNFLEMESQKVLNITLEKVNLSQKILEHLSALISKDSVNISADISKYIKDLYDWGYDIGTYRGIKSSGIYWFSEDQIIGKNGKISNTMLYQIFRKMNYSNSLPFKVVTTNSDHVRGILISMHHQYNGKVKGSINLMLTDYAINDFLDKMLNMNTKYAVIEGSDNIAFISEGFRKPFYSFNNFTILDILKNEERMYVSLLRKKITDVEYSFIAGMPNSIIIEKLVKHMFYAFTFINVAILIMHSIMKLIYKRIDQKIHEKYNINLCRLKEALSEVEVKYSIIKSENKIIQDRIKTLSISSNQNHILTRKIISKLTVKLDDIRSIIDILVRSINGELQVMLTPQKEIKILNEITHIVDNFFLSSIYYSKEKSNIKNIIDNVSKIYTSYFFDNDVELNIQYKSNLEKIYIDALALECLVITLIMYSLRGLGKEGKIDLILSVATLNNKECLKIDLSDNGFGLDLNSKLIKEDTSLDEKTLGPLSILLPTIDMLKEMVCKVNGQLDYVSRLNRGLSFKVLIPIKIVKKDKDEKSETKKCFDNVTYLFN